MAGTLVNKVAQSGLITLDMEKWLPPTTALAEVDISKGLFKGLLLKEKDFRQWLKAQDWATYQDKYVAVHCTTRAIVPHWAYMLVATYLTPHAKMQYQGSIQALETHLLLQHIAQIDIDTYANARVILKGCGERKVSPAAYQALSARLQPVVRSLMYGEPCSTVPIYKSSKK